MYYIIEFNYVVNNFVFVKLKYITRSFKFYEFEDFKMIKPKTLDY